MYALLTACGRQDLLERTLTSLNGGKCRPTAEQIEAIFMHEDSPVKRRDFEIRKLHNRLIRCHPKVRTFVTEGMGQHPSIEQFVKQIGKVFTPKDRPQHREKYYLHLEDDWEFNNSYDWMSASKAIMDLDDKVIKVLIRDGSEHPCTHGNRLAQMTSDIKHMGITYGYLEPWTNEGIDWYGFSWNPGVTRLDLLHRFLPFPKYEQDLAKLIFNAGYKVVEMRPAVYKHIGGGRNTTINDPAKNG